MGFTESEAERGDREYDEMVENRMIEDLEYKEASEREAKLSEMDAIIGQSSCRCAWPVAAIDTGK